MPVSSDFWPDDIRPKIQTPLAILRARALELNDLTKGTLIGSVSTTTETETNQTYHSLDVTVPVLKGLRQRLFTIRHGYDMVYPAYIDADLFKGLSQLDRIKIGISKTPAVSEWLEYEAATDIELIAFLKGALHSDKVRSQLVSLIALANQALEQSDADSLETPATELEGEETELERSTSGES